MKIKKDIVIRPIKKGEEEGLLRFYREFHEKGEKIANFWEWRQKGKPIIRGGTDYVALYKGRIVGAMGLNPFIHTYNGEKITSYWHRDTLVSPTMRGQGLVKKLLKVASEDWDLVLGKGSNEIMYKVRKSFGWRDVPNSDNMALVLKPWPQIKTFKNKLSYFLLYTWGTVLFDIFSDNSSKCYEIKEFSEEFNRLADDISVNTEFKLFKTSSYLNWRYFECPGRKYTVLRTPGDKKVGAIVLRLPKEKWDDAWLIDCICDPSDVTSVKDLLSSAIKLAKKYEATKILTFCTSTQIRRTLAKFGFVSIMRSPKFTYTIKPSHILTKEIENIKWNFWHGDSDNELYE